VWSLVGPGLADPGHIELASRTVYLDSDSLLGSRPQILAGTLEPHRILAAFGVATHEVLHAKHTKLWVTQRDIELADGEDERGRQLAVDRRLLEEPRMEATGVREFPQTSRRGVFIRRAPAAAVVGVLLPRFTEAIMLEAVATQTVSRELSGRSHVGLVVDTSGSMAAWEPFLGPVIWVLSTGLREFGGHCAISLFGNGAELLCDGTQPLALVHLGRRLV
jgi:hypothetical protein